MSDGPRTSKLAILALILALLFCLPVVPLIGGILGVVALSRINNANGALGGKNLAVAAIPIGLVMFMFTGVLAAIAVPNYIRFKLRSQMIEHHTMMTRIRLGQSDFFLEHRAYATIQPDGGGDGDEKGLWRGAPCPEDCNSSNVDACNTFACIGVEPAGRRTYYRYACNGDASNFTCAAYGDLDADGDGALFVFGTGNTNGEATGKIAAPIPKLGPLGLCDGDVPEGTVFECHPGEY